MTREVKSSGNSLSSLTPDMKVSKQIFASLLRQYILFQIDREG